MLKALEYIEKIGGMQKIREHELAMTKYTLEKFHKLEKEKKLELIGPYEISKRVGVFSFILPRIKNNTVIGEKFAAKNICIRCGGHCAYPLHKFIKKAGTCRMSLYLYNDRADIDAFFTALENILKKTK
jgi:cysteine desulfurase/selenocysteine lyase